MRRKAEVLKHNKNKLPISKKLNYSRTAQNNGTFKNISNARIKKLIEDSACVQDTELLTAATFSGVYGDNSILYLDSEYLFRIQYNCSNRTCIYQVVKIFLRQTDVSCVLQHIPLSFSTE